MRVYCTPHSLQRGKNKINQTERKMYICFELVSLNSPWVLLEVIILFLYVSGLVLFINIRQKSVKHLPEYIGGQAHPFHDLCPSCAVFSKQTQSESIFWLRKEASHKCLLSKHAGSPCAGSEIVVISLQCYPCNLLTSEPTSQTEIVSPHLLLSLCMSGLHTFSALTIVLQEMQTTSQISWVFLQFIPPMEGLIQCLWGIFLGFQLQWVVKWGVLWEGLRLLAGNAGVGRCYFSCSLAKEGGGKEEGQFPTSSAPSYKALVKLDFFWISAEAGFSQLKQMAEVLRTINGVLGWKRRS